jgi:protein-tyrosine sulfotransferase
MQNYKTNENINNNLLFDKATSDFILRIIQDRGYKQARQCIKDPFIMMHIDYLHYLFPNAKFIYMIRDARSSAYYYSLKKLNNFTFINKYLMEWYEFNNKVDEMCTRIGTQYCLPVKYEDLVLYTEKILKRIIRFLGESWTNDLLKHQKYEIFLSESESTQVVSVYF